MHFWMVGVVYEPHQSHARIMLVKWSKLLSLMDDFCDNYSTTEEYDIFVSSLERLGKCSIISMWYLYYIRMTNKSYTSYMI